MKSSSLSKSSPLYFNQSVTRQLIRLSLQTSYFRLLELVHFGIAMESIQNLARFRLQKKQKQCQSTFVKTGLTQQNLARIDLQTRKMPLLSMQRLVRLNLQTSTCQGTLSKIWPESICKPANAIAINHCKGWPD